MIRINLLPNARKEKRGGAPGGGGGSQIWIGAYVVAALVTCAVLGLIYVTKSSALEEQTSANTSLRRAIADVQTESANIEEVRHQLERSRQLETVVNDLQRARYGPTEVFLELSRILSVGGGPTVDPQRLEQIRRQNPLATFDPSWESRRLWVTEFTEEDRVCNIKGVGKTNEDVAEFLRRLSLSDQFEHVELVKTEGAQDTATHLPVIQFELNCRVIY